ncbi:MAG: hypothetical protein IJ745_03240 [Bacteroidales bacterium]|nr:hypothetical protein [Bacteroidales bacterium]
MAKQQHGINDGFRGTVGTVIGYEWRGRWCLRSRPRTVRNPRTERQQENRTLFRQVVALTALLRPVLRHGLRQRSQAAHMTEANYFHHINKSLFGMDSEGRLTVDYEALALSEGPVAPVGFAAPSAETQHEASPRSATVTFERNPLHLNSNSDDEVWLVALCPEAGEVCLSAPAMRRSRQATLTLPDHWTDMDVHLYGFVTDYAGRASASSYIGCLAPSTAAVDRMGDELELDGAEQLALEDVAPDDAIVRIVGRLEGRAVAHDETGIGDGHALGAAQEGGDQLRE